MLLKKVVSTPIPREKSELTSIKEVGSTPGVGENNTTVEAFMCLCLFLLYLARVVDAPTPLGSPHRTADSHEAHPPPAQTWLEEGTHEGHSFPITAQSTMQAGHRPPP
jgi:hypothetical protein